MTSGSGDVVMNMSEAIAVPHSFVPPGGDPAAQPAGSNPLQLAGGNPMHGGPAAIQNLMTAGGNSMQLEAQQTTLVRMSPSRNAATFSSSPTKPQL